MKPRDPDTPSISELRAAVAKGDAELDRGEGIPYTRELLATWTQAALQEMHSDQPINPDVLETPSAGAVSNPSKIP